MQSLKERKTTELFKVISDSEQGNTAMRKNVVNISGFSPFSCP